MTEGTKSYFFGCHHFLLHPLWVLFAWKLEYKKWPRFWQIICIFLHDIGHLGKQYLSNEEDKKMHWVTGAIIAKKFYGEKGFLFIAGHDSSSGYPRSALWKPDKRSWLVAPMWHLWMNYFIEWHNSGLHVTRPPIWRKLVEENLKQERPLDSHELYLKHKKKQ